MERRARIGKTRGNRQKVVDETTQLFSRILLAGRGASIAITSTTNRIEDRARDLRSRGAEVFAMVADLSDHEQARALAELVVARFGRIDILVNNAGMIRVGNPGTMVNVSLPEVSEKDWDYGIAINLKTAYNVQL